ncbi:hypothetical protein FZC84_01960 [Rossellomorea vietnamensis]|uniref:Uncharacterized protein n=1 Tax=Rossellomorea vietnamensis TaxID=218284 RepID=A0A5D4MHX7_9BACI|nr:hypothetical protein FZC84_01960 [Rossellomorea vietnamensis]
MFIRLQFTPYTLPSDIVGQEYLDVKASDFKLRTRPELNTQLNSIYPNPYLFLR